MFKYLDTTKEDAERLKKARSNINKGCALASITFILAYLIGVLFLLISVTIGLLFIVIGIIFVVMSGNLMIKREIFSMMIWLKEDKE